MQMPESTQFGWLLTLNPKTSVPPFGTSRKYNPTLRPHIIGPGDGGRTVLFIPFQPVSFRSRFAFGSLLIASSQMRWRVEGETRPEWFLFAYQTKFCFRCSFLCLMQTRWRDLIYFERQMRIAAKAITPCPHGHLFAPQNPPMMNVSFQWSTVCVCVWVLKGKGSVGFSAPLRKNARSVWVSVHLTLDPINVPPCLRFNQ